MRKTRRMRCAIIGAILVLAFMAYAYKVLIPNADAQLVLDEANLLIDSQDPANIAKALGLLQEASITAPHVADLHVSRSYAYSLLNEHDKAAQAARTAYTIDPENMQAYANYGVACTALSRTEEVQKTLQRITELTPQSANDYLISSRAHHHFSHSDKADLMVNKALELEPQFAEAHLQKGILLNARKKYREALPVLALAISDGTGQIKLNGYMQRGYAAEMLSQFPQAMADYEAAMYIDPQNALPYYYRGTLYRKQSKDTLALKDYDTALHLNFDYADVYIARGRIWHRQKKYQKALADYARAIKLQPDDGWYYFHRARTYFKISQLDAALKDYNKALSFNPGHSSFLLSRGRLFSRRKEWQRAIADFNAVLKIEPGHKDLRVFRAWAYLGNNDATLALQDCDWLITQKVDLPTAYAFRSVAHIYLFEDQKAHEDFALAEKLVRQKKLQPGLTGLRRVQQLAAKAKKERYALKVGNTKG